MFKKITFASLLALQLFAGSTSYAHDVANNDQFYKTVNSFVNSVLAGNAKYTQSVDPKFFKSFKNNQTPRATVVMCSDSRVQTDAIGTDNINDLFVIRNIGNQVKNNSGSVEYGVRYLHTPVVLIVGHSGCGAVEAAMSDKRLKHENVERELVGLRIDEAKNLNEAVVQNVNKQVASTQAKFADLVSEKKLVVIGAVYDFQNSFGEGLGKLSIVNIDGETNPDKILQNPYFKNSKGNFVIKPKK